MAQKLQKPRKVSLKCWLHIYRIQYKHTAYHGILLLEKCPDPSTQEPCGLVIPVGMAAFVSCYNGGLYIVRCEAGKWEPSLPLCKCN